MNPQADFLSLRIALFKETKTITNLTGVQRSTATKWLNAKRGYKKSVIKEANIRILKLEIIFVGLPSTILEIVCRFLIREVSSFRKQEMLLRAATRGKITKTPKTEVLPGF